MSPVEVETYCLRRTGMEQIEKKVIPDGEPTTLSSGETEVLIFPEENGITITLSNPEGQTTVDNYPGPGPFIKTSGNLRILFERT